MATIAAYEIGDAPVLTITVKDIDGVVGDPGGLTVTVKPLGDTAVVYTYGSSSELTKTSTGVYKLALPTFTTAGRRDVKATSTGTNSASEQTTISVIESNVA